jgi:hypothetical protein
MLASSSRSLAARSLRRRSRRARRKASGCTGVLVPAESEIPARACTCSFCAKHGGVCTSCPTGSLTVSVNDRACVSTIRVRHHSAEFHVSTACGVVPVVTSRSDSRLDGRSSVSTHFENVEPALLRRAPATLESENEQTRLRPRKHNWIAGVQFDVAS